tara:strand:- start:819 stop:1655 length:837 start_codon:yes stop_codon:yes gene_type:complete
MEISCLTWNTAKRVKCVLEQKNFIEKFDPDIVALQEILLSSEVKFKQLLLKNYKYILSSFELAPDLNLLTHKRMFGQIIASKFPLKPEDPNNFDIPWKERVLSAKIKIKDKNIYFHTTHIPPGSSNGWIKIETLEGIYNRLIKTKDSLNILCGDFNLPKEESVSKGMLSFAQTKNVKDEVKIKNTFRGGDGKRWDIGERNIMIGLKEYGIEDSFRNLYSYKTQEYSWKFKRKDKILKRRFDHFFANKRFKVVSAKYLHSQKKLSDHSSLLVKYDIKNA